MPQARRADHFRLRTSGERAASSEAARSPLVRSRGRPGLRARGPRVAERRGVARARVAVARKLARVLHRMWADGPGRIAGGRPPALLLRSVVADTRVLAVQYLLSPLRRGRACAVLDSYHDPGACGRDGHQIAPSYIRRRLDRLRVYPENWPS